MRVQLVVVALLALGACGHRTDVGGAVDPGADRPSPGDYVADDLPPPYAAGDRLWLTVREDEVSAQATCNTFSGPADWGGGVLELSRLAGTEMGCRGDGHAQDDWLVDFLTSSPEVTVVDGGMLLTGEQAELRLAPADR